MKHKSGLLNNYYSLFQWWDEVMDIFDGVSLLIVAYFN